MSQLTTSHPALPATISQELEVEVAVRSNRLDPEGIGFSIAAEDAPGAAMRRAMQVRVAELGRALAPIGTRGAAAEVGALSMALKSRGKSEKEADATLDLYVRNLADLPAFAVVEACRDYQQGRAGDRRWMPEVPELRVRALDKQRVLAAERAQIERVLKAKVRPPRATPEQRAAAVAMARKVAEEIAMAGRKVEAQRDGRVFDEAREAKPETPDEALRRLARARDEAPVALSPELRRQDLIRRGVDVAALDEAARLQREFDEQRDQVA